MRTYELVVVYDPRVVDDEVGTLIGEVKNLLTAPGGVTITKTEHWGRRRLAYPIQKVNEGKYAVVYFAAEDGRAPIGEVERRLLQNDRVLRFLTTRTDEGLKRAGLPIPTEVQPDAPAPAAAGGAGETAAARQSEGGEGESGEAAAAEPGAEEPVEEGE
jgi:small subunit ribosomal protein S6